MGLFRYRAEERTNIGKAEQDGKRNAALEAYLAQRRADGEIATLSTALSSFQTSTNIALAGKEPTITAGTTGQYWRGDKTWRAIAISEITGLSSALTGLSDVAGTKVAKAGDTMTGPLVMPIYLKAALPSVAAYARSMVYVSDLTGGAEFCYSDGTNWRRLSDRSIAN